MPRLTLRQALAEAYDAGWRDHRNGVPSPIAYETAKFMIEDMHPAYAAGPRLRRTAQLYLNFPTPGRRIDLEHAIAAATPKPAKIPPNCRCGHWKGAHEKGKGCVGIGDSRGNDAPCDCTTYRAKPAKKARAKKC